MTAFITTAVFGILMIILGTINAMGNIHSLHWYHRQRVLPEDVKPYGRVVGIGNITLGAALIVFGILNYVFEQTSETVFVIIGTAVLLIGAAICLALSFYGMIKYNKGIF